ncbi:MAG: DNA-protecting protein DprA, partial [Deltaproteobacteria bacterium]|nr:DNA-protecting protein DprA [Deltaproteobacteria bacterium]
LRALCDAPAVLFADGRAEVLQRRMVAVVGTRSCSAAGTQLAFQLGRTLAEAGLVVVSGLARGIDAAAHRGALQTGETVAVVGHGLGWTSPAHHRDLRREIARNGAIVTAFTDGLGPDRWTFPCRNRWLAGLCEALVVIEAPATSGALITADVAVELDRPVYAFPGPAGSALHAGVHQLIRSGTAQLVDSPEEVRDLLVQDLAAPVRPPWRIALFRGEPLEDVARLRGVSTLELLCELQRLEVRGEVVRMPGQRYVEGKGRE